MPSNQSSPWGGGKLRACSSIDGTPTAAAVYTQDETGAACKVPLSQSSIELSWGKDQAKHQCSTAASSVASPTGSPQEKRDRNKTSIWNQFSAVPDGPQQQKWIYCPNQILAPSEPKRMDSSSSYGCTEEPQLMEALQKRAALQTKLSGNNSVVRSHQGSSVDEGLEPHSLVNHQDLLIRGLSSLRQSSQLTPEAADCLSSPPVPHVCLDLHKHQGAAPGRNPSCHESTKLEGRSTRRQTNATRRSRSAKTAMQRSRTQSARTSVSSVHGQLLVRGVPAATTDCEPRTASSLSLTRQSLQSGRPLGMTRSTSRGIGPSPHGVTTSELSAIQRQQQPMWLDVSADVSSSHAAALVGSVTSQISAIHLTKHGQPSSKSSPSSSSSSPTEECLVRDAQLAGSECVMQVDGVEEELPDELENACSDDDDSDGSSIIDTSSTASIALLSSIEEPMILGAEDHREEQPALVPSLFPLMPPTLYFSTANEKVELLPAEQRRLLKWKMSTVTPNIVKHTIARSHFKATKKSHDWLGCWGHHMKSPDFRALGENQKLNHFPGTFQIGRKDRLWRNLSKMQLRFGKQEFSFIPRTFVLPQDIKLLRKAWEDGGSKQKWIIKPPASARGIGIQVIHKWSQMPRKRPLLVQKYLHKPYLIMGNKFDLRIYVYVTSYDPLRIYVFSDGLVRFASCKYSSSMKTLSNKFMHLTNYSVNKKNSEYQTNSDDKACQGHKWALKALWQYLGSKGVNTTLIWEKIKDIVIKTIIASEPYVNTLLKMHVKKPHSCHELFGFDIMLDENLKPWILEVNISPSLHSNSPLDVSIKGQMIRDLLNLAGFHIPQREEVVSPSSSASSSTSSLYGGNRERTKPDLSADEKVKRAFYLTQRYADQEFLSSVLDVLTPEDVRVLAESENELSRRGEFQRVFPSPSSSRYLRFFECPRYLNILLDQWEQKHWNDRTKSISLLRTLCQKGVHLGTSDPAHMWSKCNYVSRCETLRHGVMSPPRSRVVVTHQHHPHHSPADGNCSDMEAASSSPGSSVTSSGCASPQPSLTQSFQE